MTAATSYARALFELVSHNPERGKEYLKNMREALVRRGHERLLPRIFSEYERLVLRQERATLHTKVTPEKERTRILLELYRTLIKSPTA